MEFFDRRCRACGSMNNLHRHHIKFRSQFGKKRMAEREADENYMDLCALDHERVHSKDLYIVKYPSGRVRFIERRVWDVIYGNKKPGDIEIGELENDI
jgi:hypothetical protein